MGYLETDDNFVDEWAEQWCGLVDLLYETIRIDKPPAVPLQPGLVEESLYQNLRSWFIENEARFLPLWKRYFQSLDWTLDTSLDIFQQIMMQISARRTHSSLFTMSKASIAYYIVSQVRLRDTRLRSKPGTPQWIC